MAENDPKEVGYSRPGFLTKADRQYLREQPEGDYAEKRRRIRERTKSAFQDFSLLYHQLSPRDRKLIFEDYDDMPHHKVLSRLESDLSANITDLFAFVWLGLSDHWSPRNPGPYSHPNYRLDPFNEVVKEGMESAYEDYGYILQRVDFDITAFDQGHIEKIKSTVRNGRMVSPGDFEDLSSDEQRGVVSIDDGPDISAQEWHEMMAENVATLISAGEIDMQNLQDFLQKELSDED